jgi:XRE family transcriptional regulator, aerobic/anaerobic benzoate catabolism transcriptional regulator
LTTKQHASPSGQSTLEAQPTPMLDEGSSSYLANLGQRVRALRKSRDLSRRELSERSGLSQRFIAQLETGAGNISVLRLKDLMHALGGDIASIVSNGSDEVTADALAKRVQMAPGPVRARIEALLDETSELSASPQKSRRIALIGLRGAGKSTLGQMAASSLALQFVELNSNLERENGLRVGEIFSLYGESGYRRLEREQLVRVADHDNLVLAVAGGIVDNSETYAFLRAHFWTVWLQASPDEHMARVVAQGDNRPMAGNPDAMVDLRRILNARQANYALADAVYNTSGQTIEDSAEQLTDLLVKRFLDANG